MLDVFLNWLGGTFVKPDEFGDLAGVRVFVSGIEPFVVMAVKEILWLMLGEKWCEKRGAESVGLEHMFFTEEFIGALAFCESARCDVWRQEGGVVGEHDIDGGMWSVRARGGVKSALEFLWRGNLLVPERGLVSFWIGVFWRWWIAESAINGVCSAEGKEVEGCAKRMNRAARKMVHVWSVWG